MNVPAVAGGDAGPPRICIVGRCAFQSGIGQHGYGFAEVLARSFPVCYLPTEPQARAASHVTLPNGRRVPVCRDLDAVQVSIFCDVLWNGEWDFNYALMPEHGLRIAVLVFDSDQLPERWVALLNHRFDLALALSEPVIEVARASGVDIPVEHLPLPLDLEPLLARRPAPKRPGAPITIGSVAAFHPRKNVEALLDGFLSRFAGREDVELVLHSNLAFGETVTRIERRAAAADAANVKVSHQALDDAAKAELIAGFDVFAQVSSGEGYSIGPREALALGKPLVLSEVGGHRGLLGIPGVFGVTPSRTGPARYPEIEGLVFGRQHVVATEDVGAALERAVAYAGSDAAARERQARCRAAAEFSFEALTDRAAAILDPALARLRRQRRPVPVLSPSAQAVVAERLAPAIIHGRVRLGRQQRRVVPAHDGGFFSVFNAYVSHLAWDLKDRRIHEVLPDWDVGRLLDRVGTGRLGSFCYGQPGDGNIYTRLFAPPFGLDPALLDDPDYLYDDAQRPTFVHNERREPTMTYVHAYKLYNSRDFASWRAHYHRVLRDHIVLRPDLAAEIAQFRARHFDGRAVIGAHVRHPSHTIEQPDAVIAHEDAYLDRIRAWLAERRLTGRSEGWTVFLATDQDRVVDRFRDVFGDRVACFEDVRRTRAAEDAAYGRLDAAERGREGHQLQHLVAADRASWSLRMAEEVIRDAWLMAGCDTLLHVVSNVSTAVSYINPNVNMVFCSANR